MINLYDGELADILPDHLKTQPEYQAISYALKRAWQRLHKYAAQASVFACIDSLPEEMLDLLAVEMKTQYYEQDFDIETKRNVVKQSILWNIKSGTKFAVDNVIQTIYGGGEEVDWYDYGGIPGHFKLTLEAVKSYDFNKIISLIDKIKRKSAKLDGIEMIMRSEQTLYYGAITAFNNSERLRMQFVDFEATMNWLVDEETNTLIDEDGNVLLD